MENKFSKEDIYLYIQNGGNLNLIKHYMGDINIEEIPQQYINKRAENGASLDSFNKLQIKNIPQDSINKFAARSLNWSYFAKDRRIYIPQDIVNEYVANGGEMFYLSDEQIINIPQEYINKRVENGCVMEEYFFEQGQYENIPQDIINKRAEKGYSLDGLPKDKIKNIPQDIINIYASKGGDLFAITSQQLKAIPLKNWCEYVANGGNLSISISVELQNKQIFEKVPQEYFNKRAENGHDMSGVSKDRITNVPLDCNDKRLENDRWVINYTDNQLLNIKILSLNKYYANGHPFDPNAKDHYGCFIHDPKVYKKLTPKISDKILVPTKKGKQALILYAIDKMKAKDLPVDVFVNHHLRNNFLNILKVKTINKFNQMCKEKGFVDSVPPELQKAFYEKLQSFSAYVERRKEEGVKALSDEIEKKISDFNSKKEQLKQELLNDIKSLEI